MVKLIAEGGINHNGDIDICKKMIDICAFSGFNYFKLQKRNPDKCVPSMSKQYLICGASLPFQSLPA